jgi:putative peptide zinc metalloprotease protein
MTGREPPTTTAPRAPAPANGDRPPRLADGVELIGEFEDSGFKEAPFIARRSDGQVVQLPAMLFRLAEQVDGRRTYEEIADRFSDAIERRVEAADAQMLIEEQLRPLGVVGPADGESVELGKVDPLLALKFRAAVVPDRAVRALTTVFRPLFLPPILVAIVLAMIGLDGWLFFVHGVSQSLRHTLYQPLLMLMLIGGVVLATAWHEIGHATAVRYGGAEPGVMGVGVYIVWPAFYTDITDAYRLGKWGRVRTDIGGMYFNAIFALMAAAAYALTSFEPLLLLVVLQNFAILQQSLPFLRLDGYYILSDLTGVPDIFLRIRSVLSSFIPGRPADERVTALKSWVRVVVSGYVVLVVVFFAVTILALVLNFPRMLATGYDSAALRYQAVGPAFSAGRGLDGALDIVQLVFLALPGAGLAYTAARVGGRSSVGALRWAHGSPPRQAALALAGAAGLALAAFSWWPNGEYRPVQPGERGTLTGVVNEVAALPTGRPSLTPQRQRQLGGAPTQRQLQAPATRRGLVTPPVDVTSTTDTTTTSTDTTPTPTTDTTAAPPPPAPAPAATGTPTTSTTPSGSTTTPTTSTTPAAP